MTYTVKGEVKYVFYVRSTKDKSTAKLGGILPLDMIISIEGKPITENFDMTRALKGRKVGESISLEILRTGEIKKLLMKIY